MIITNFKNLARNSLRRKALLIAEAGYEAIEIEKVVNSKCQVSNIKDKGFLVIKLQKKQERVKLNDFKRIFLIGIGKGSALACISLAKILDKKLTGGIALDAQKLKTQNLKLKTFIGTHPLPSKANIIATQRIIKLAKKLNRDDLLITFICGGGSALACASKKELKDLILITKSLTKAGANILELNTVRKHLSEIKGGGLVKMAYPATVISLIASDIIGNNLSMVASGPTVFDKTTKKDVIRILKKYKFQIPNSKFQMKETPKDKEYFKKVKNVLFVCNQDAILAMSKKAKKSGFKPKIYSLAIKGEARNSLLPMIKKIKPREAFLAGGETTVTLRQAPAEGEARQRRQSKGGRNMEAVLGALVHSLNSKFYILNSDLIIMSFASDGRDNTEAAGAIGDYLTVKKSQKLNFQEYLNNHDSFNFFKKTGDLIYIRPKSFNVADLMVILKE